MTIQSEIEKRHLKDKIEDAINKRISPNDMELVELTIEDDTVTAEVHFISLGMNVAFPCYFDYDILASKESDEEIVDCISAVLVEDEIWVALNQDPQFPFRETAKRLSHGLMVEEIEEMYNMIENFSEIQVRHRGMIM